MSYFDPRHIMDYWERENREPNPWEIGPPHAEPYEWGLEDAERNSTLEKVVPAAQITGGAAGLAGSLGLAGSVLGPAGMGLGLVATVAGMIGKKKAEEEQEEQREKAEALRRAAFMSQNRKQAVGRWGY